MKLKHTTVAPLFHKSYRNLKNERSHLIRFETNEDELLGRLVSFMRDSFFKHNLSLGANFCGNLYFNGQMKFHVIHIILQQ